VLADEPTGKLDRAAGAQVVDVLLQVCADTGAALLISTHDRTVASRLDAVWTLRDGELVG
jgi:predicted ABC-type transport system involved in lysophospholipase L1 biosynthesis ATPase subunit